MDSLTNQKIVWRYYNISLNHVCILYTYLSYLFKYNIKLIEIINYRIIIINFIIKILCRLHID